MGNENAHLSGGKGTFSDNVSQGNVSATNKRKNNKVEVVEDDGDDFNDSLEDSEEEPEEDFDDDDIESLAIKTTKRLKEKRIPKQRDEILKVERNRPKLRNDSYRSDDEDSLPSVSSSSDEDEMRSEKRKSRRKSRREMDERMGESKIQTLEEVEETLADLQSHFKNACRRIKEFEKTKKVTHVMQDSLVDSVEQIELLIKHLDLYFYENRKRTISSERMFKKVEQSFKTRREDIKNRMKSGRYRDNIYEIKHYKFKKKKPANSMDRYRRMKKRRMEKHKVVEREDDDEDEVLEKRVQRQQLARKQKFALTQEVADTVKVEEEIAREYNRELRGLNTEMNMVNDMMNDMKHLVEVQGSMVDQIEGNVEGAVEDVQKGRKHVKRARRLQLTNIVKGAAFN